MALVQFFEGNRGIYNYTNIQNFDPVMMTSTSFRAEYNGGEGPYDPTVTPFAFELSLSNAKLYTFQTGPRNGEMTYAGGKIVGVNYFDNLGNLLISITDINSDLSYFMAKVLKGNAFDLYDYWVQGGSSFVGSNDSSGSPGDWTGDDIRTGSGNDIIKAGGGDDYIKDAGGADIYIGGKGQDTVTYDEWYWNPEGMKSGIRVNLAEGKIIGPDGFVDTVKNIEDVRGTFLRDVFIGNEKDNVFDGFQGRDYFDGGKGFDVVRYRNDERQGGFDGIEANLAAGTVRDGFGTLDKLVRIEGVVGTETDDVFVDNNRSNYFRGRDGDDRYTLTGGNDYINDREGGADFFEFKGSQIGYNTIEGFDEDIGERDLIFIQGVFNLSDLSIFQDGSNVVIEAWNGTIELRDFDVSDVGANDFVFDIA